MSNFTTEELRENANYIIKILSSQKTIMWSWGARGFCVLDREGKKTLRMRVSGLKHKGYVYISLNEGTDLFEVYATTLQNVVKKENTRVYFDELVSVVDDIVEKGEMSKEEYSKKLSKVRYSF